MKKPYGRCPCLTRARGSGNGHWSMFKHRWTSLTEKFKLQGLDRWQYDLSMVSESQIGAMLGNSFSQPVMTGVMRRALISIGVLASVCAAGASIMTLGNGCLSWKISPKLDGISLHGRVYSAPGPPCGRNGA